LFVSNSSFAGTCPLGKAYDYISSSSPSLTPIVFKPSTLPGTKSTNKLSAVFIPAAQSAGFRALRRDQKFVVRIMTTTGVTSPVAPYGTFAWRFEEDEYYQPEQEMNIYMSPTKSFPLSKASDPTIRSGVYIYWDPKKGNTDSFEDTLGEIVAGDTYEFTLAYNEGDSFDGSDSNTAHQLIECSGRGTCDFSSGRCTCLTGYTGEACQRTICPNSCSGHGSCQTELRFASDGLSENAVGYTAYDGDQQYGCKCDKGYRGPDCSLSEFFFFPVFSPFFLVKTIAPRDGGGETRTNECGPLSRSPTPWSSIKSPSASYSPSL
jgi:hypothetical protein